MLNKRSFVSHRFDRCKIDPTEVISLKWEYTETNGRLFNMSLIMVRVIMVKRNKLKQTVVCLTLVWSL